MANNKLSLNAIVRVDSKKSVVEYLYTLQKYITVIGVKNWLIAIKEIQLTFLGRKRKWWRK